MGETNGATTLLPLQGGQVKAAAAAPQSRNDRSFGVYVLFLIAFLSVQFGHGSNIGVAVSLHGDSKAMNLALGSWVMVGVCLGLLITPAVCRRFGSFRVCCVCLFVDVLAILLMLTPNITIHTMYLARFLVGFFEAPFLPYLQQWLAVFGAHHWNVYNTLLHAMVPLGENVGFLVAQELVELGFHWQWAFAGQAIALVLSIGACAIYGGRRYLDLDQDESEEPPPRNSGTWNDLARLSGVHEDVEYAPTEMWCTFWSTNVALASQLGFLSGWKYVIRAYSEQREGFSLHFTLCAFSFIALVGPALGGAAAMSGQIIRPDRWSQHPRTLLFLISTSAIAACFAGVLIVAAGYVFWLVLFCCFIFAGGVYPAAQGILNISLTEERVIDASVFQVQCNNLLFAMPMPFVIGMSMDNYGVLPTFYGVLSLQLVTAMSFFVAWAGAVSGCCQPKARHTEVASDDPLE